MTTTNLPRPQQPKPLAVPADHRFRFDDDKGGPPVLPKLAQLRPEKSIRSGLGSFHGPLQHTKLVPQGEDLELKDRSRTEHRQNRREQCGDHEGRGESPKEGQLPIDQPNRIFRQPQSERNIRRITAIGRWERQRKAWQDIGRRRFPKGDQFLSVRSLLVSRSR